MLDLNITTLIQMGLFLIFAVLMNQVFFGPVTRVLSERRDHLHQQELAAKAALEQAQALQADYEQKLKAAHGESQHTIQTAIRDAELKRQALLESVKQDVLHELEAARASIRSERDKALQSLQGEVKPLSDLIKQKVQAASPALATGSEA
jgi:F-type H+-transporting ATPase subunit b